jgi:hypothetical protein
MPADSGKATKKKGKLLQKRGTKMCEISEM